MVRPPHTWSLACRDTPVLPQATSQVEEILDYRDRLGVPEYLVRWCGSLIRTDTWESEGKLLPSAKAMVDAFQQQRAQRRKERKQRLLCGVPCETQPGWCGGERQAAPPTPPPAAQTGSLSAESAPAPPAAAGTPFSSVSSSPPAARPEPLVDDDDRVTASEPTRPSPSQPVQPTAVARLVASLSPQDVTALLAVNHGWLDRFVALFSSRLSRSHMAKLLRSLQPLAQGHGADFGPTVGCFLAGRPVQLSSDVSSLRRELAASRGGIFKRADQSKGGWVVSHPLMKLAEFQARLHATPLAAMGRRETEDRRVRVGCAGQDRDAAGMRLRLGPGARGRRGRSQWSAGGRKGRERDVGTGGGGDRSA